MIIDSFIIMRKEFDEVLRNKYILSTMASFPLVFSVAIPLIYLITLPVNISAADVSMFQGLVAGFDSMTPRQVLIYYIVQSNLPFYLMMPAVIPTLISSYSIVGEKKGGTLEPLLATPVSSRDVLFGKSLAAVVPSVLITWVSFGIYAALVNYMTHGIFGHAILPDSLWIISVGITAPLLSLMSVYACILVSSRITDVRAAQQVSAVFVVPIMALFILQLFGYVALSFEAMASFSVMLGVVDLFLIWAGTKVFKREEILTRWA